MPEPVVYAPGQPYYHQWTDTVGVREASRGTECRRITGKQSEFRVTSLGTARKRGLEPCPSRTCLRAEFVVRTPR